MCHYTSHLSYSIILKPNQVSVVVSQVDPLSWILWRDPMSLKDEWDPSAISNYGFCLTDNHTTWFGFYLIISYFIE